MSLRWRRCAAAERLGDATAKAFRDHPDYEVITSFPGLGELGESCSMAETGDDRAGFADSRP